jgi:SAM-dependent methyltransferase
MHKVKETVRKAYGGIASKKGSCCGSDLKANTVARVSGYSNEELSSIPEDANLGLSCGNPVAIASLKEGETVLDLGSGAGIDCFLASKRVGETGRVIGVDMTTEMIERARENARKENFKNVEFKLGDIENLPVEDNSIDVVISNCVINLAPDKGRVFKEIYRVLKSGGRMIMSDIVLTGKLPSWIKNNVNAYVGCIAGAVQMDDYLKMIKDAGLSNPAILQKSDSSCCDSNDPIAKLADKAIKGIGAALEIVSITVAAGKK